MSKYRTPPKTSNTTQRTTVAVLITFEGRHISILEIKQQKSPITNQIDSK